MSPDFFPLPTIPKLNDLMAKIPGGEIELRDDRIKQNWTVEIAPFLLAKFPVTQDFYFEITNESPSVFSGDKRPVEMVSWRNAVIFCNILSDKTGLKPFYIINHIDKEEIESDINADGYRLPTEAEWEYACRANMKSIRYGEMDRIGWYKDNSGGMTHDVGMMEPNPWGLYDMLGNVWEWCSDVYDETVYGSYRIFRGGGWNDSERGCMATNRRRSHPTLFKIDDLGFRIARNLNENYR